MLLTIGLIGAVILVVGCGIFLGFREPGVPNQRVVAAKHGRPAFFGEDTTVLEVRQPPSLETLLSELEQYIRTENVAAEEFLRSPTPESLHIGTDSPWVN